MASGTHVRVEGVGKRYGGAAALGGLDLELVQFTTGLELFQAMIGGSLDMLDRRPASS